MMSWFRRMKLRAWVDRACEPGEVLLRLRAWVEGEWRDRQETRLAIRAAAELEERKRRRLEVARIVMERS